MKSLSKHFCISEKLFGIASFLWYPSIYFSLKNVVPNIISFISSLAFEILFIIMLYDADDYIEKKGARIRMSKKKIVLLCLLNIIMFTGFIFSLYFLFAGREITGHHFTFILSSSCMFLVGMFIINKIILYVDMSTKEGKTEKENDKYQ